MQMSSATADHLQEAAEYYEASVRHKYEIFPRGHCSNVTFYFLCGFTRNNLGVWVKTRCHLWLRDTVI